MGVRLKSWEIQIAVQRAALHSESQRQHPVDPFMENQLYSELRHSGSGASGDHGAARDGPGGADRATTGLRVPVKQFRRRGARRGTSFGERRFPDAGIRLRRSSVGRSFWRRPTKPNRRRVSSRSTGRRASNSGRRRSAREAFPKRIERTRTPRVPSPVTARAYSSHSTTTRG